MSAASARSTMSLIPFGILAFFSRGDVISSPRISFSMSAGAGVSYGSEPVIIWYIVTPIE